LSKLITFMIYMWLAVVIAGGVVQGSTVSVATTTLVTAIDDDDTTITVRSTAGFPNVGFINILDERIGYSHTTATTFTQTMVVGDVVNPVIRGAEGTVAVAHVAGELVRTTESAILNQSLSYKLATMSDASGIVAFVTIPYAFISLIITFLTLPIGFLGTDLQIIAYIWGALSIGVIATIAISLVGGRRV